MVEALKINDYLIKNPDFSKAKIARRLRLSRARVSQITSLVNLAPDIQKHILISNNTYTERQLRPLTRLECHEKQRKMFAQLCPHCP